MQCTTAVQSYRHLICYLSTSKCFAYCLCFHICFSCSHHKQLNGDLKGITLAMFAFHEQEALMDFS